MATRAELKTLRQAFLDAKAPVDKFSESIAHLEKLMAKFPERAGDLRKQIHAIRREMDSARFARRASNDAGFLSDLDAGLARNRARDAAFMAAQIPVDVGGAASKSGMVLLKQNAEAASRAISALNGGSVIPLIGSLTALGPAAAIAVGAAGVGLFITKTIQAADAARQAREAFFEELDAFREMGGDTSFADHLERVESLSTKWSRATEALNFYMASLGEHLIQTAETVDGGTAGSLLGRMLGGGVGSEIGRRVGASGEVAAGLAIDAAQLDPLKVAKQRLEAEKKALEERQRLEKEAERERMEWARQRADENERRADEFRARERQKNEETARRLKEAEDRDRRIKESTRTPAERLQRELGELGLSGVDPETRRRALLSLRERAAGLLPAEAARPAEVRLGTAQAIRAGSVEALRAQFPGGTKEEKALKAAETTAKESAAATALLAKIDAKLAELGGVGVMP